MTKQITFSEDARAQILSGVEQLSKAVACTMGAKGRNVIIERPGMSPLVTKDGVSVAKEVELEDALENMGAQLVKEAAIRTNDIAGDGTTTATVLAHAIMQEGLKHLQKGANPIAIKRGIDKAVVAVSAHLDTLKRDVETRDEYKAVATISAQDEEVGEVIAEMLEKVGGSGVITVDKGNTLGIETEFVEGYEFDSGYISRHFVTNEERQEAVYDNTHVLVTDHRISSMQQIIPLIERMAQAGHKNLIIIADAIEGEALTALVVNKIRGIFNSVCIKAPSFAENRAEMLKDIAAVTGASLISTATGDTIEKVTVDQLGICNRLIATPESTTILGGAGTDDEIDTRAKQVESELHKAKSEYDQERLSERLAKLASGIAVIKVGAASEVEQVERQHRVEDALSATRAAAEEGILPGGGVALLECVPMLAKMVAEEKNEDERTGMSIVQGALKYPAKHILDNAGVDEEVFNQLMDSDNSIGYNVVTDSLEDMFEARVIDPKKVTRSALENAASVASMFLTLEAAINVIPQENPVHPMMQPIQ